MVRPLRSKVKTGPLSLADAEAKALYEKMFGDKLQLSEAELRQFLGAFIKQHPEMGNLYNPDTVVSEAIDGSNFK